MEYAMETRIDRIRERIIELTLTKPRSTESYATLIHLNSVSQLATFFAMNRSLDWELAAAAGLLHDIDVLVNGSNADHAFRSSIIAREMLVSFGFFSENDIDTIVSSIAKHSDKSKVDEIYDEILKDADTMSYYLQKPYENINNEGPRKERLKRIFKEFGGEGFVL